MKIVEKQFIENEKKIKELISSNDELSKLKDIKNNIFRFIFNSIQIRAICRST